MKIITGSEAVKIKKGNMAMWDSIDDTAESFIKAIAEYSDKDINVEKLEDEITEIGKEVTEIVVRALEKLGGEFVYADCNY